MASCLLVLGLSVGTVVEAPPAAAGDCPEVGNLYGVLNESHFYPIPWTFGQRVLPTGSTYFASGGPWWGDYVESSSETLWFWFGDPAEPPVQIPRTTCHDGYGERWLFAPWSASHTYTTVGLESYAPLAICRDGATPQAQPDGTWTFPCWVGFGNTYIVVDQPDGDVDGWPDDVDECPDRQGSGASSGCPGDGDVDGDGTGEPNDPCPGRWGPPANSGCPEPPPEDPPCSQSTIAATSPGAISGGKWTATFAVSPDDGLVARDVRLDGRRMAAEISLPYLQVRTSRGSGRIELSPDSTSTGARSRLVQLENRSGAAGIDVVARYAVDSPGAGGGGCLLVTQRYRFDRPRARGSQQQNERVWCNPLQRVGPVPVGDNDWTGRGFDCGWFYPTVTYLFDGGSSGEDLMSLEAPQRLHLVPGTQQLPSGGPTTGGLFKDCDTSQRGGGLAYLVAWQECLRVSRPTHPAIQYSVNPLTQERVTVAVSRDLRPGPYDNFHCQLGSRVPAPAFDASWVPGAWGCPKCVHIHWRWGTGANYAPGRDATPRFTSGVPMVASTEQDVTVAVTTNGPETVDPVTTGWRALANLEPVAQRDLVFWYVGKSRADRDTFFRHGGFFADL